MRHLLLLFVLGATSVSVVAQRPEDLISAGPMLGHVTETTVKGTNSTQKATCVKTIMRQAVFPGGTDSASAMTQT